MESKEKKNFVIFGLPRLDYHIGIVSTNVPLFKIQFRATSQPPKQIKSKANDLEFVFALTTSGVAHLVHRGRDRSISALLNGSRPDFSDAKLIKLKLHSFRTD